MGRILSAIKSFFLRLFRKKAVPALARRVFFFYPEGHRVDDEADVYYEDAYFDASPEVDNPSLTTCSLGLAMASFSSNKLKEGLQNQAVNGVNFLQNCGFSEIETPDYFSEATDKEGIAFIIGKKTIGKGKKQFHLIAIGVRGGNYGKEWSSNMKVGLGDRHEGFDLAAKKLHASFDEYCSRHKIKGEVRVWVAGFSRAAAVTNLFAHDLQNSFVRCVYAYCFACPNTVRNNVSADAFIHVYVNAYDMVPLMPIKEWGYSRYGVVTTFLPPYSDEFSSVHLDFTRILNKEKRMRREKMNKSDFLLTLTKYLGERIGLLDYVHKFQDTLCDLMNLIDPKLENPYQAISEISGEAIRALLEQNNAFHLLVKLGSKKTDWDALLRPAVSKALEGKGYAIDAAEISSAISDFLYLVRDDIWTERDLFLTLSDKSNFVSVMKEHQPILYLQALKDRDPKYGGNH